MAGVPRRGGGVMRGQGGGIAGYGINGGIGKRCFQARSYTLSVSTYPQFFAPFHLCPTMSIIDLFLEEIATRIYIYPISQSTAIPPPAEASPCLDTTVDYLLSKQ